MDSTLFDYAIIGGGAAGLHLALAMSEDPYFQSKKILILEKNKKDQNDRTWCFWEKGPGKWDEIVSETWEKTLFIGNYKHTVIELGAYTYKMVKGIDFYNSAFKQLKQLENITTIHTEVKSIDQGLPNKIFTNVQTFQADHVFDSRIPSDFFKKGNQHIQLKQHFTGWVIETQKDVFTPDAFTMMDYRLRYPDTTSFTYILPFTKRKALVEFTFFSPSLVSKETYENYLKQYVSEILLIDQFTIKQQEEGIIPMTDYPFHKYNNEFITKIGTAGGWVKGSSGYSFKNAERKSQLILDNLKRDQMPSQDLFRNRFQMYDSLFLDVLLNNNDLGPQLFSDMYHKNDIETIFSFLDEETNFGQELKLMNTFDKVLFTKTILQRIFKF